MDTTKKSNRIAYIDVSKGILILCLLYGHLRVISESIGMSDSVLKVIWGTEQIYLSFFMQTFFIITGFCSNFDIKFGTFLKKNIKTLLIPAIILTILDSLLVTVTRGGDNYLEILLSPVKWLYVVNCGPWFIIAMFWGKIIYWGIRKIKLPVQYVIIPLIYIVGLLLVKLGVTNIQYHQHMLLMIPYLFLGELFRKNKESLARFIKPVAIFGIISLAVQFLLCQVTSYTFPVHDYGIRINFRNAPINIINVLSGTALTFYIAKKLQNCRVLSQIGQGTLFIYLMNTSVQIAVIKLIQPLYCADSFWKCAGFHCLSYILCATAFYFLIKIVYGTKYLSWMVGK